MKKMNTKKTPVINYNAALSRILLMIIAIIIGIIISFSSEAGVKIERNPFNKSVQKKKKHSYSCDVLMEKHRSSSNIVVKINGRRPKWR